MILPSQVNSYMWQINPRASKEATGQLTSDGEAGHPTTLLGKVTGQPTERKVACQLTSLGEARKSAHERETAELPRRRSRRRATAMNVQTDHNSEVAESPQR